MTAQRLSVCKLFEKVLYLTDSFLIWSFFIGSECRIFISKQGVLRIEKLPEL